MTDSPTPNQRMPDRVAMVARVLFVAGLAMGATTVVFFGALLVAATDTVFGRGWPIAYAVFLCLVPGAGVATLLVGVSRLIRLLCDLRETLVRLDAQQTQITTEVGKLRDTRSTTLDPGMETFVEGSEPVASPFASEILALLRAAAENSLLTDAERTEKARRRAEEDWTQTESQIAKLINEGDYISAQAMAHALAARRPDDPRAATLASQVDAARQQRQAVDVAAITKEVNDLISMSAWPQARARAQRLQEQHPDSVEARQLMVRIEHEYGLAQDEQRRRMYAEVQRFVTRRRWEEALAAAQTFIERFAGSDDAEALRLQIPTLKLNAEIETRQQLEAQIMDLARHGRYIEAVNLARRVIEQYPDSPQAEALRRQIGRLEELATNPQAPPARVRIE